MNAGNHHAVASVCVCVCVCICKHLHVAEHVDHDDHADTAQSTGHHCVLQAVLLVSAGHAVPPLAASVMIVRERVWEGSAAAPCALHMPTASRVSRHGAHMLQQPCNEHHHHEPRAKAPACR